jgi:hypothetical protein
VNAGQQEEAVAIARRRHRLLQGAEAGALPRCSAQQQGCVFISGDQKARAPSLCAKYAASSRLNETRMKVRATAGPSDAAPAGCLSWADPGPCKIHDMSGKRTLCSSPGVMAPGAAADGLYASARPAAGLSSTKSSAGSSGAGLPSQASSPAERTCAKRKHGGSRKVPSLKRLAQLQSAGGWRPLYPAAPPHDSRVVMIHLQHSKTLDTLESLTATRAERLQIS